MITDLGGVTSKITATMLDLLSLNHKVIANNIANANSQNYATRMIDFDKILASVASQSQVSTLETMPATLEQLQQKITDGSVITEDTQATVQLDVEMAKLVENTLRYQSLLEGMSKYGSLKSMAIKGSNRGAS